MVTTNEDGKTPADLAKEQGHLDLAKRLETLVVFKVDNGIITCVCVCVCVSVCLSVYTYVCVCLCTFCPEAQPCMVDLPLCLSLFP